ncbi:MAG: hypothetical protein OXU51_11280 [Candidatus Poribacteria bacterium]|nr:hypothetical protein [Candidatus Poribacteria bacterium]
MRLRKIFYYTFMLSVIACIGMSVSIVFAQDNALKGGTLRGQIADTTKLRHQDQQAVARYIAAWIGQELILTGDQHKNLEQSLLDATANESFPTLLDATANAMHLFEIDILEALHLIGDKLEISLEELLTQAQYHLVQGIAAKKMAKGNKVVVEFRLRSFAIAKLRAHADLLDPLNKEASRRLSAIEGVVVQQYIDAQDTDPEAAYRETAAKLRQAVEAGEITHEKATEKLEILRGKPDITDHPLYQQAIKDVLSEDAFKQYRAHQTERDNLRQQALRDRMVAIIDSQLLLDETQRNYLETVVAQLTLRASNEDAVIEMFIQLPQQVDAEMLNPWQRREFRHMFGPPMMEE